MASIIAASLLVSRNVRAAGEIVVDVFFGGEVCAPGRLARRAIRERAEHARAGGIRVRAHERMAARGAVDVHGRVRGDAAVFARRQFARPALRIALQLHHRDAMRGLHERHRMRMLIEPGLAASELHVGAAMAGTHQLAVDVFVVHAHQAARGASPRPAENTPRRRRWCRTGVPGCATAPASSQSSSARRRVSKSGVPVTRLSPQRATMLWR